MGSPRRILIVRLSHLGDVACALPVYHAARARFPEAEIAWAVQPEFAGLLEPMPGLARVFLFARRDGARAWWRLWRELRAFAPELTIDAQGNAKSAAVAWLSGAPRRIGLARADWREGLAAAWANEHARPASGEHAMDRMQALARHVAGDEIRPLRRDPELGAAERARGPELLDSWLAPGAAPVILHLGAPGDPRTWPLEHSRALATELARRGHPVLVLAGPSELESGRALARDLQGEPRVRHATGILGLRDLAILLDAARARDARLVGPDSGPLHLATACGLAVVELSGPTAPERTGPWPPSRTPDSPHRVVRAAGAPECAPCHSRRCHHPAGPVCMARIAPDDVLATLDAG